jgi:hypothetical protein
MSDDWHIHQNQKRYDEQQGKKLLESARGYGPGKNDIFAWGFIIGGGVGSILERTLEGVLLWAFGGLAVALVLRVLASLLSRR